MKNLFPRSRSFFSQKEKHIFKQGSPELRAKANPEQRNADIEYSKEQKLESRRERMNLLEDVNKVQITYNKTLENWNKKKIELQKIDPHRFNEKLFIEKFLPTGSRSEKADLSYYKDENDMRLPTEHEQGHWERKTNVIQKEIDSMDKLIKSHEKVKAWQTQCPQADITIEIHNWEYKITKVGDRDALTDFIRNGKATWLERHVLPPGFQTLQENH